MGRDTIRLDVGRKLFALGLLFAGCAQPTDAPRSLDGFVEQSFDGGHGGGEDLAHGGTSGCPTGFGDCDGNPANGCESMLNTPDNCGACGKICQQLGGSNACVLEGGSYVCKPSCDATHADCDGNPADGCETDLSSTQSCGACMSFCTNAHGSTACGQSGSSWACQPTCAAGWSACGAPAAGCATQTDSDSDHCGACSRPCSTANASARNCAGGVCRPTCNAPYADCSTPTAPAADDGCETNPTTDPGENDNACPGQSTPDTGEGSSTTINGNRILPSGDTDTFTMWLREASHACVPFTPQTYYSKISFQGPPEGTPLQVGARLNSCDNTWQSVTSSWICVKWGGTCGATDDLQIWFQMSGVGGAASCSDYQVTVEYCPSQQPCSGCPS
jgi:hypothetical protein